MMRPGVLLFALLGGCSGAPLDGSYDGSFECTDLDADTAELVIDGDVGTLAFLPSAGGAMVEAPLTNLVTLEREERVSFDAKFDAVPGEDAPLSFSFNLDADIHDHRLTGPGSLVTGNGSVQDCQATFSE